MVRMLIRQYVSLKRNTDTGLEVEIALAGGRNADGQRSLADREHHANISRHAFVRTVAYARVPTVRILPDHTLPPDTQARVDVHPLQTMPDSARCQCPPLLMRRPVFLRPDLHGSARIVIMRAEPEIASSLDEPSRSHRTPYVGEMLSNHNTSRQIRDNA